MTKELALDHNIAQYPNPNPKPELFGQTRPEVKKPYSSGLGHGGLEAGDSKIDPLGWA